MYVTITTTEPEHYKLDMPSDLDTTGTYAGHDSEHGIQFERGGKPFTLYRTNGEDIGLKSLIGTKECRKVQYGEVYCRECGRGDGGREWERGSEGGREKSEQK